MCMMAFSHQRLTVPTTSIIRHHPLRLRCCPLPPRRQAICRANSNRAPCVRLAPPIGHQNHHFEPAIKPAAHNSKTQTIGILATKGTLSSELFNKTVELYQDTTIVEQIGHGLVELIESGAIDSPEMDKLLHSYLTPMIEKNIDYLVLGCSHYPYLIPKIKKILPEHIQIIDSGEAVARQTQAVLKDKIGISKVQKSTPLFYTNGNPKVLSDILENKYNVVERQF